MSRIDKPISRKNVINTFSMAQLVTDCLKNEYILVIGSEAVLSLHENPEAQGDSTQLLRDLEGFFAQQKRASQDYVYAQRSIYERMREMVKPYFFDNVSSEELLKEVEPSLIDLLKTRRFPYVLTTTIDPYIEVVMEYVWGKGNFSVKNIYDLRNKDISEEDAAQDAFGLSKPTLYYLFGKIDPYAQTNFVVTDNDKIEVVAKWLSSESPSELKKLLSKKKIIAAGFNFDDWLFRFLWYILRGYTTSNVIPGHVAIEYNNFTPNLKTYLTSEQKVELKENSRIVMADIAKRINAAIDNMRLPHIPGGIFISYYHEDKWFAYAISNKLSTQGYSVWVDKQIEESDPYNPIIRDAITRCKIFMPILTPHIASDLETGEYKNHYYCKEWEQIENRLVLEGRNAVKVLPVLYGGYDVHREYHRNTPPCILDVAAYEFDSRTIDNLFSKISNLLK